MPDRDRSEKYDRDFNRDNDTRMRDRFSRDEGDRGDRDWSSERQGSHYAAGREFGGGGDFRSRDDYQHGDRSWGQSRGDESTRDEFYNPLGIGGGGRQDYQSRDWDRNQSRDWNRDVGQQRNQGGWQQNQGRDWGSGSSSQSQNRNDWSTGTGNRDWNVGGTSGSWGTGSGSNWGSGTGSRDWSGSSGRDWGTSGREGSFGGGMGSDRSSRDVSGISQPGTRGFGTGMQQSFAGRGPRNYSRTDERIREDIIQRLTEHPAIDATDVDVQVKSGEVTLMGTVDERNQRRVAEDIVEDVWGVRDVHNNIKINRPSLWDRMTGNAADESDSGDKKKDKEKAA